MLTIGMRWTDRLIGLLSTLILARLLVPDDFGVIAQASLVVGLLSVLTDLGVQVALIQRSDIDQSHFDTAWTLRLIQLSVVAALVFLLAPYAADYFGDERVVTVLRVMTLTLLLSGIENIGVVRFQKDMEFGREFRFLFSKRVAGFTITMVLAFVWRSYWALVIGAIVGQLVGVVLSYVMQQMRPRLSLLRFSEIFAVSQWSLVRGIGLYLDGNLDRMIIGSRQSTAVVGGYTVANEVSMMPATELLAPLNRVLFPAFVRAREEIGELKRLFLMAQGIQVLVAFPASVGLSLVAEEAVTVLLGENWLLAVPFVQWLALAYVAQAIATSAGYVLITLGRIRDHAAAVWSQVGLFIISVVVFLPDSDAQAIAIVRVISSALGMLMTFLLLKRVMSSLRIAEIGASVIRPLLAVVVMAVIVIQLGRIIDGSTLVALLAKVAAGAVSYVGAIAVLWIIAGRPSGAETYLFDKASALVFAKAR